MTLPRRKVVKAISVSAIGITSISGCLSLQNNEAKLSEMLLINLDSVEHEVLVRVLRDEKKVYQNAFSLDPSAEFGTEPYPAPVITEDWMGDAGRYTVECRLKTEADVEKRQFPSKNRDGDCFSVEIRVSKGGTLSVPYTRTDSCK